MSDETSKEDQKHNDGWQFRKKQLDDLYRPYRSELPEYMDQGNGRWREDHTEGISGWKFHLNVEPNNVKEVSNLLKDKGFKHKYLKGGEVDSGKIFTVYTGSKRMTERGVRMISDNLGHLLATPKAGGEVPFAPNIVGRFEGNEAEYANKVSKDGIVLTKLRALSTLKDMKIKDEDVEFSRKQLLSDYGKYFGGEITYYDPTKY